jgi:HEAT repeat protein
VKITSIPRSSGRPLSVFPCYLIFGIWIVVYGCATPSPGPPVMESYDQAVQYLSSPDWEARLEAVSYLGANRNPEAIGVIAARLSDENLWVRLEATLALRNFQTPLAIEPLRAALGDESFDVRFSAAVALFELDDYSGEKVMIEGLDNPRDEFRLQAVMALGKMRSRAAVPGMIKLLQDRQPRTRSAAAYILGFFREPSAIGPLLELMKDPVAYVRKDAWEALKNITGLGYEFHWQGDERLQNQELKVWQDWWEREGSKVELHNQSWP